MLRTAWAMLLLAALGGCAEMDQRPPGSSWGGGWGGGSVWGAETPSHTYSATTVAGVQGPWGQPVAMASPYSASPPSGAEAARAMMAQNIPMNMVQVGATSVPGSRSGIIQAGGQGAISPAGVPFQPGTSAPPPPGAVAAVGALTGSSQGQFPTKRTEVRFISPPGMKVSWASAGPDGRPVMASHVDVPGRYNFVQGAIYRLKLSDIPNRPALELYPTLEVVPSNARSDTFLAHSAVPVAFTDEDFDQVAVGNYVVKVVYLPDPQFQDLAIVGPDELVSTRLPPGADPIAEAYRRGSILLVVRLGNIDLEAPGTPAMNAASPYGSGQGQNGSCPPGMSQMPRMGMPQMPGMPTGMMMGPNGPMMGPNGPMMGPNGPMMNMPNLPPANANGQGQPMSQQQPQTGPVSTEPSPASVQQMQYNTTAAKAATTAGLAAGQTADGSTTEKKPASKHWWWQSDSSNK